MDGVWTDEETETWLESETRVLVLPNGITRPFTGLKLLWRLYDDLTNIHGYSSAQLLKWAVQETQATGVSFDIAFPSIVAYVDRHVRKRATLV
jgi:hypothetical protein